MDELQKCKSLNDLQTALRNLPSGLRKTYDRILANMNDSDKKIALTIFRWLLFSKRPMTILELDDAVALAPTACEDVPTGEFSGLLGNELSHPTDILLICSGLVRVVYRIFPYFSYSVSDSEELEWDDPAVLQGENLENIQIQLAHASVLEYLLAPNGILNEGYRSREMESHRYIAQTCLTYLVQFSDRDDLEDYYSKSLPLSSYAAEEWSEFEFAAASPIYLTCYSIAHPKEWGGV
jgi:hypothetical protein